jgi:hypothetical protein
MDSFPEILFMHPPFVDLNMHSRETLPFILTLQCKRARSAGFFYLSINLGSFYQNPPPSSPTRNEKLWMKL